MEAVLHERFGRYGLGADRDRDLPIIGAVHNAAGYLVSEMFGCEVRYRADAAPDVLHVDAWLAGNVFRTFTCEWRGDRRRFPEGWTDRLRERGVRSSVWLNPFLLTGSDLAEEARAQGVLLRGADGSPAHTDDRDNRWIVDFTNPRAVRWWQERVADLLATERPDAVKLDFAEEIPEHARCFDGRDGAQIRNSYSRLYQAATAEALRVLRPEEPVPMFCRSGTHGAQQYPAHWVGDSPATWDGLASALYAVSSLALSGFGIVAHDAGGFVSPGTGDIPTARLDGLDVPFTAEVDPELYARWVQWGSVTPFMRLHGLGLREPTAYPDPFREAAIDAFRLRRRLMDYLWHSYREGLRDGLPLLRPMVLQMPEDRAARDADLQYFLGPDVLVAPILQPGGRREFYLPRGQWVNIFDRSQCTGDGWTPACFPIGSFPAFARVGSAADAASRSGTDTEP
jgi:alpha-D-xyloside xylohydrolase